MYRADQHSPQRKLFKPQPSVADDDSPLFMIGGELTSFECEETLSQHDVRGAQDGRGYARIPKSTKPSESEIHLMVK